MRHSVRGNFPRNPLLILMYPAPSSFDRWMDRLPLVSPVVCCRYLKSASSMAANKAMTMRRAGSWIVRSIPPTSWMSAPTGILRCRGLGQEAAEDYASGDDLDQTDGPKPDRKS